MEKNRENRIADVRASIQKLWDKGKEKSYDNIVISTMSALNISRRAAQEYVDVALYQLGTDRSKLPAQDGNKKIATNAKTNPK